MSCCILIAGAKTAGHSACFVVLAVVAQSDNRQRFYLWNEQLQEKNKAKEIIQRKDKQAAQKNHRSVNKNQPDKGFHLYPVVYPIFLIQCR